MSLLTQLFIYTRKEIFVRILIKSNWNQIVITLFWSLWRQTDVRLVPNKSEKWYIQSDFGLIYQDSEKISLCKYILILVWLNKIPRIFLLVYMNGAPVLWEWVDVPCICVFHVNFIHQLTFKFGRETISQLHMKWVQYCTTMYACNRYVPPTTLKAIRDDVIDTQFIVHYWR